MKRGLMLVALAACSTNDRLDDRLRHTASFFESGLSRLERATVAGEPCYPVVDGYVHHKVTDLGRVVAKQRQTFEDAFNHVVLLFDVYKTDVGPRFDAIGKRLNAWTAGPLARAIESCKRCVDDAGADFERCRVP